MRRSVRPFTVEHKRGARAASATDTLVLDDPAPVMTATMPEAPRYSAPEPTRWAAAEALFSIPPAGAPDPTTSGDPTPSRRILPSLNEPAAPAYVFEDAPRRRGRKPGSRNKPRAAETQGPQTINTVARNVFAYWAQEPVVDDADGAQTAEKALAIAALPEVVLARPITTPPLALARRGRLERTDMPRGLRWQARLPHFAR